MWNMLCSLFSYKCILTLNSPSKIAWEWFLWLKCNTPVFFSSSSFPRQLGKAEMSIRLVCILLRLDVSGSDRRELSSSEVPLRAWEKGMHVRSSKEGWTSHSPDLHSGSVCRLTEAGATRPGANSISGSWLAGERVAAQGKEGKRWPDSFPHAFRETYVTINQKSKSGASNGRQDLGFHSS